MNTDTPKAEDVKFQLKTILQSEEFSASKRLKDFLQFVVEKTLAGKEYEIKAYTVATEVFKRGTDFDPISDPVVRVEAAKLRNKLNHYYISRKGSTKDKVRIDIPKGAYVPAFWVIEEKIKQPVDNYSPQLSNSLRGSIAILPFINLGESKEIDYLLSGLAEELALAITKFEDLTVVTAIGMKIDNDALDNFDEVLASRLGVRFILSGNAQLAHSKIRLRINLIDTATRKIIWADKFESEYTAKNLFNIIDSTSNQVASRIGDSFGWIKRTLISEFPESRRTKELEAYEAVLYYHYWAVNLATDRFELAKQALEQAIKADPDYALAHGMLADIYATHYQWDNLPHPDYLDLAHNFANQSLNLDPQNQYGLWAKAYTYFLRGDNEEFLFFARQAVSINPADTYLTATAGLKIALSGQWDEGRALIASARRLNPFLPSWFHTADCLYYYYNGNLQAALNEATQITSPRMSGPILRSAIYGKLGKKAEAEAEIKKVKEIYPAFPKQYRELISRMFYSEAMLEPLLTGLALAGLQNEAENNKFGEKETTKG